MSNTLSLQITANNTALASLAETKAAVIGLSTTAQIQIGGLQGLGGAFQRFERREPAMAVRDLRFAMNELAASATGLSPGLARIISTFAQLGIGGAIGIGAVAGVAAIGVEIKGIIDYTNSLDRNLEAINAKFAAMVPLAGGLSKLSALQGVLGTEESAADKGLLPDQPGIFARFSARLDDVWESIFGQDSTITVGAGGAHQHRLVVPRADGGDITQAFTAQTQAGLTQVGLMTQRQKDAVDAEHAALLLRETNAVEMSNIALERARLGTTATAAALDALAHRQDEVRLSTQTLTAEHRAGILANDDEIRAIGRRHEAEALALSQMGVTSATFPLYESIGERIALAIGHGARVIMLNEGRGPSTVPTGPDVFARTAAWAPPKDDAWRHGDIATFGATGDKIGAAVARTLAANLPSLVGAVSRGDAGGTLSGLGGAAVGLSNIKGLSALGPVGMVASSIGALFSLFSGGGAKVTITGLEERALAQMKTLTGTPNSVQVYLVDPATGNVRQTQFAINHAGRMDVVTRLPQP